MKKTVLVFMILVTMLTGCNNAKTSSNETINETNTVSSENGKISNKEENSFVYAVPKDESEREDTITIQLSDNENGTSYEYTIPLIFANSILQ